MRYNQFRKLCCPTTVCAQSFLKLMFHHRYKKAQMKTNQDENKEKKNIAEIDVWSEQPQPNDLQKCTRFSFLNWLQFIKNVFLFRDYFCVSFWLDSYDGSHADVDRRNYWSALLIWMDFVFNWRLNSFQKQKKKQQNFHQECLPTAAYITTRKNNYRKKTRTINGPNWDIFFFWLFTIERCLDSFLTIGCSS